MEEVTDDEYEKLKFWERVKYEWEHSGVFEDVWRLLHNRGKREVKQDENKCGD